MRLSKEHHILATVLEQTAERIRKNAIGLNIVEDLDDGQPIIYPNGNLLSSMTKVTNVEVDYNKDSHLNEAKFLLSQKYIGYAPDFYIAEAEDALDNYAIWQDETIDVSPKNIANFAYWLQQSDSFMESITNAVRNELESFLEETEDVDRIEGEDND